MPHPPEVLAMILCDQVITDVQTNKKSLIGLFDQIETASLPCLIHELHNYRRLTTGHGWLPMPVTCVADDGGDELFRGEADVEFSHPLRVVELQFIFPNARFSRAGEYHVHLSALGQVLRERKFLVGYLCP